MVKNIVIALVRGREPATTIKGAVAMAAMRRLIGVLIGVSLCAAVPARADVVTDWNAITISTIGAGPVAARPARLIEFAMVHIAMHDAVQAIQQRFQTYSPGITPTSGSVIAAAAKAARDVLVNRFSAQTAALDMTYSAYLAAHQIAANDPGIAAGSQAAAAIIQGRVNDGALPGSRADLHGRYWPRGVAAHSFRCRWRADPDAGCLVGYGETLHADALLAVLCARSAADHQPPIHPRLQRGESARKECGVDAHGEQTAIAKFHSGNALNLWNQTLRALADQYIKDVGDSARLFALVNMAMADAGMSSWQSKIHKHVAPDHGDSKW